MLATTTEATETADVFVPLNLALFCAIVVATIIGIPLYGYYYGFSLFDWVLSLVMYIVTGMGITVGYHRLVSHQSFVAGSPARRFAEAHAVVEATFCQHRQTHAPIETRGCCALCMPPATVFP